jgi:hypothetical protein
MRKFVIYVEDVQGEYPEAKLGIRDFPNIAPKSSNQGVNHVEIGNLLEELKNGILGTLYSSHMDVFQAKQK